MKLRIATWATAGAFAVAFWSLYFLLNTTHLGPLAVPWVLVDVTMPIALLRHYAMSVYFALFVNAATYALVGACVEMLWRRYRLHLPHRIAG
jgi:hypothetical protein